MIDDQAVVAIVPRNAARTLAYTLEGAVLKDPAPDGSDATGERSLETIALSGNKDVVCDEGTTNRYRN